MSEDVLQCYREAGRIASKTREEANRLVREGMPVIEVCNRVEALIEELGGKPAFPCNVCINEVAAHYSSPPGDTEKIPEGSVVKVDIGVHVNGYIADTATTLCFNQAYNGLRYAVEEALEEAIKLIRPGVKTSAVGATVQRVIERRGFKPIRNLTGHQVGRYAIHTGKSIPNVVTLDGTRIEEGDVFAIEPFATLQSGAGEVHGAEEAYIYRLHRERSLRDADARRLLEVIKTKYKTLPFSARWLRGVMPEGEVNHALSTLLSSRSVVAYPVLVERREVVVTQAEQTFIVTRDGCELTTL